MRSRMYKIFQRLNDIAKMWNSRNVKDATAEDEWSEYENLLYVIAEWIYGDCRRFHG